MSLRNVFPIVLFLLASLSPFACKNEQPPAQTFDQKLLPGRWEVLQAIQNGRETDRMNGLFFEFQPEGRMLTNFTVVSQEHEYDFDGSKIKQESEPPLTYLVESLSDTLLSMSFSFRESPFQLTLRKAQAGGGSGEIMQ
ncbi:MAG: hypothetical protein AAB316_03945 [Bacteroidota bacterium]